MSQRVYLAGHRGLLGSALTRLLGARADVELVHDIAGRVDLRDEAATRNVIGSAAPDVLILAAGRVGGLGANLADPVGFFEDNLRIQLNVLRAAHESGVDRLLFVASANAYPASASQPIVEEALGTGPMDPGTEPYGLAKLTGMRLCDSYRRQHGRLWHSVVPCNLYGPGDRFEPATAHVVPAMLRRLHDAVDRGLDEVVVWGSGRQRRQLLYVDDLARACELLLQLEDPPTHVNVAPLGDTSIRELAQLSAEVVGYRGRIEFDANKPEGAPRRELDSLRIRDLGWEPALDLESGLRRTWEWFLASRRDIITTSEGESA